MCITIRMKGEYSLLKRLKFPEGKISFLNRNQSGVTIN